MNEKENWDAWYELDKPKEEVESEIVSERMNQEREAEERKMMEGLDLNSKYKKPYSRQEEIRKIEELKIEKETQILNKKLSLLSDLIAIVAFILLIFIFFKLVN